MPYEVNFSSTYWGTIEDLHDVVAMYRAGQIVPAVERYSMTTRWRPTASCATASCRRGPWSCRTGGEPRNHRVVTLTTTGGVPQNIVS